MEAPDVSVIVPVRDGAPLASRTVRSALAQEGARLEVLVIDDASSDGTTALAQRLAEDPRVRAVANLSPRGALEARREGLERARGAFVTFLDCGQTLLPGAIARALEALKGKGADLAAAAAEGGPETGARVVGSGSAARAVFGEGACAFTLNGVFSSAGLAREAFSAIPCRRVSRDSELAVLFALCQGAKRLAIVPGPLCAPAEEPSPLQPALTAEAFAERCKSAQAAAAVGRVISRRDQWDACRRDYSSLVDRLLEPLLSDFPHNVVPEDRAAAFEALAEAWPAAELVSGLARWRGDGALLPALEAVHASAPLRARLEGRAERIALLCPPGHGADMGDLRDAALACRALGLRPKILVDKGVEAPRGCGSVFGLPAWEPGGDYLPRARALLSALREHGADAVAAPLSEDACLPYDLLLARLSGIPAVGLAPLRAQGALLAGGSLPRLMAAAQPLSVLGVPTPKGAVFWSMASHARIVAVEEGEPLEDFWSRLVDTLEEGPEVPREAFSPTLSALGALTPGGAPVPSPGAQQAAEARIRALERQTSLLQARLATARDEARVLREQLVAAGSLPSSLKTPEEPLDE